MNRPKLFVDFDNTIAESTKCVCSMLNNIYHKNVDAQDITRYDFRDRFPKTNAEEVEKLFASQEFFESLKFYPNCARALYELSYNIDIVIVSIGNKTNINRKKIWIADNLPFVSDFIGLILSEDKSNLSDKSCVDMSDGIVIDDHIECLRSTNARTKILFFSHPKGEWQKIHLSDNVRVSDDWLAIKKYIQSEVL